MAAARALLTAAGLLKPKTKLSKTSTATEHSTSSSQLDPADSTDVKSRRSKLQAAASESGFWLEDDALNNIVALLMWMAQDFQPYIHINNIHDAVLQAVIKCADAPTGGTLGLLSTACVTKLSKLIDIMILHKDGSPKDPNATLAFMRRVARFREELLATATKRVDNATERVELDENDVSSCYQRFGRDLITHDLLPHQSQDKRYRLRNNFNGDTNLSGFQRSFVDNMLRKNLGERRVAMLIWQHGIPSLADLPTFKVLDMGMLQSSLDECMQWYICLANDIAVHQTQEGFDIQMEASSLGEQERQRQQTRREALQKARDASRLGAILAKQRDDGKRAYDDMDDAEQTILQDYETGRTKKAKQDLTAPRLKPFRCKLQIND